MPFYTCHCGGRFPEVIAGVCEVGLLNFPTSWSFVTTGFIAWKALISDLMVGSSRHSRCTSHCQWTNHGPHECSQEFDLKPFAFSTRPIVPRWVYTAFECPVGFHRPTYLYRRTTFCRYEYLPELGLPWGSRQKSSVRGNFPVSGTFACGSLLGPERRCCGLHTPVSAGWSLLAPTISSCIQDGRQPVHGWIWILELWKPCPGSQSTLHLVCFPRWRLMWLLISHHQVSFPLRFSWRSRSTPLPVWFT